MTTEITRRDETPIAVRHELTIEELVAQVQKIQAAMQKVMTDGEHYGVIPGTKKPTLLKPGAEKLCLLFRLDPQYEVTNHQEGDHLTVESRCVLWHIPTGNRMGSGMGSCSTKESKYAFREAHRRCPECQRETIIKGKEEYGGGWLCFQKKGGCGAKFKDGDGAIEEQATGQIANDRLPDQYNTVLKMANKRSLVAVVLNVTAASDIFTQDLEETAEPMKLMVPGIAQAPQTPPVTAPVTDPAPPEQSVNDLRTVLLGRIVGIEDKLGMKARARADLWVKHCPGATPENADPAVLQDLYAELVKLAGPK